MSEMTVGSIRTTVNPPLASGVYEALLEKAERENAELADRLSGLELSTTQQLAEMEKEIERLKNFADNVHTELMEARKENEEQSRLLGKGGEREARLATERDHYKSALEEISTTIQEYKDSMVQEPAEDFIWAIKAWADKKLNQL